jgi:multidrug transporter EmrE-like cation transporter
MTALFLSLAVAFNVAHNAALKVSAGHQAWTRVAWVAVAMALGAVNALSFSRALERLGLATAYPIFSGSSIAITVLVGALAFRERLAWTSVVGVFAIAVGIVLVQR